MISAAFLSVFLLVVCSLIHYRILSFLRLSLKHIYIIPRRSKLLAVILGAMSSHFVQIFVFGAAYYLLRDKFGLGQFSGDFRDSFSSFLYFSTESYTSLGLGDIFPKGPIRLLAGIESLTGLVMIGWTSSFTYLEMTQYWKDS